MKLWMEIPNFHHLFSNLTRKIECNCWVLPWWWIRRRGLKSDFSSFFSLWHTKLSKKRSFMASLKCCMPAWWVENLKHRRSSMRKETRHRTIQTTNLPLVYLALPGDDFEIELTYKSMDHGPCYWRFYNHLALSSDNLRLDNAKHKALGYPTTDIRLAWQSGPLLFRDRSRWLSGWSHSAINLI